jgi:hypothetical protein
MAVRIDHAVLGERAGCDDEIELEAHSLIPAVATTRFQRAISFSTRSPSRSGLSTTGVRPCFANASRMSGSCSRALISVLSFATASRGVPAGA